MLECEYSERCLNNDKCWKCYNNILLKLPEDKKKKQMKQKSKRDLEKSKKSFNNTKDSWRSLEQEVSMQLNNIPTIQEARRTRRSGALDFEQGDVLDSVLHPECKERTGSTLKSGEKSMSIKKEWLEKAAKECEGMDKTMCLPFRFKGDDEIYTIIKFEELASLVTLLKAYIIEDELNKRNGI